MPRISLAFLEYVFRRRSSQRRESPLEPQDSIVTFRAPNRERAKQIIKKRAPLVHSPISVLNDDVLLHIFYIHRLHIGTDLENDWYEPGYLGCDRQRWWYKVIHVSRRWRSVILDAPSLLDLHLVCTRGVPVADMLAHSPPLPLTIVYWFDSYTGTMTAEDEEGAFLALSHRDRVHNIAICMPSWELEKLFVVMDEQFPILERLTINYSNLEGPGVTLPRTFGAPNLFNLILMNVALPIRCPLLTTAGLVSLLLRDIPRSGYFPPRCILASLSLMPQLETLCIMFKYPVSSRAVRDTAIISHVTLPNLREFRFGGVRAYLEGLCARMTAPVLSVFRIRFPNQLTFNVPHLLSFMLTPQSFIFHVIKLSCSRNSVQLQGDPQLSGRGPFDLNIPCHYLDWQISSAIQILDALSPVLSVAEQVSLFVKSDRPSQPNNNVDRTQWRGLLRPLSNVKVLRVVTNVRGYGLGQSLRTEDGEQPLELLPNLEEVRYSGRDGRNEFAPFINEREAVGRPVRLTL
jgi:hypothetical protein